MHLQTYPRPYSTSRVSTGWAEPYPDCTAAPVDPRVSKPTIRPSSDPEHILINSNNDEEEDNGSGNNGESWKYNEDIEEGLNDPLILTADDEDR